MGKVVLICGRICSGKSRYAARLRDSCSGIILSADEATWYLCGNRQGQLYDLLCERTKLYLIKKSADAAAAGCTVILDWGFWTALERREISGYFISKGVKYEWHYIDIDEISLRKNIHDRNRCVISGQDSCNFYVDDALTGKCAELFESPSAQEIDVWHTVKR